MDIRFAEIDPTEADGGFWADSVERLQIGRDVIFLQSERTNADLSLTCV